MTIRSATYIGTVALLSQLLLAHGCGSNNSSTIAAAGTTGTADATAGRRARHDGSGGRHGLHASAGTTGAAAPLATTPAGGFRRRSGRAKTPRRPGHGGAASAPATTSAGGTAANYDGPSGGGSTGSTGAFRFLLCSTLLTAAGSIPAKAVVCHGTAKSAALLRYLRPKSVGFKSKPARAEPTRSSQVLFPRESDYSCYKIPSVVDPSCPLPWPQASQPCSVAIACPATSMVATGDSKGAAKTGYCVCPTTSAGTPGKWTCAKHNRLAVPGGARVAEGEQF